MKLGDSLSVALALLLAMVALHGLALLVLGRWPVPWSSWRRVEPHWVRAYGGFLLLLAAGVTAYKAFHTGAATYALLAAAVVPPLLAAIEDNRRARR